MASISYIVQYVKRVDISGGQAILRNVPSLSKLSRVFIQFYFFSSSKGSSSIDKGEKREASTDDETPKMLPFVNNGSSPSTMYQLTTTFSLNSAFCLIISIKSRFYCHLAIRMITSMVVICKAIRFVTRDCLI